MSLSKEQVLARMSECGVVAVIRAPSKELLTDITRALLAGGVISVEVTMSHSAITKNTASFVSDMDRAIPHETMKTRLPAASASG